MIGGVFFWATWLSPGWYLIWGCVLPAVAESCSLFTTFLRVFDVHIPLAAENTCQTQSSRAYIQPNHLHCKLQLPARKILPQYSNKMNRKYLFETCVRDSKHVYTGRPTSSDHRLQSSCPLALQGPTLRCRAQARQVGRLWGIDI